MVGRPFFARFVVINTTPPAALDPYIAAAASLRNDTLSISAGLNELSALKPGRGIPSTITNGSVTLVEEAPLIWKFHPSLPGCAELLVTVTPGACPCKAASGFARGPLS